MESTHGLARAVVERYGANLVPWAERNSRWWDVALIMFAFSVNPAFLVIPAMAVVVGGIPPAGTVAVMLLGWLLSMPIVALSALPGVDYGLPGQVAYRAVFGVRGCPWIVSPLRALTSCYWFAFQTIGGALALHAFLGILGVQMPFALLTLLLAVFQGVLAILGFNGLVYAGRVALPAIILLSGVLTGQALTHSSGLLRGESLWVGHWGNLWAWAGLVAGMWLPVCTSAPDFTRYGRSRWGMSGGMLLGTAAGMVLCAVVSGLFAAVARDWNIFQTSVQFIGGTRWLAALLVLTVFVDVSITNSINIYGSGMALTNLFPRVGRVGITGAVAMVAIGLSLFPSIVMEAQQTLSQIGRVFAPVAGVVLAEYMVARRFAIQPEQLFVLDGAYRYRDGFNVAAFVLVLLGVFVYPFVPPYLPASFAIVVIVAVGYLAGRGVWYREQQDPALLRVSRAEPIQPKE